MSSHITSIMENLDLAFGGRSQWGVVDLTRALLGQRRNNGRIMADRAIAAIAAKRTTEWMEECCSEEKQQKAYEKAYKEAVEEVRRDWEAIHPEVRLGEEPGFCAGYVREF